jgi:zinc protease
LSATIFWKIAAGGLAACATTLAASSQFMETLPTHRVVLDNGLTLIVREDRTAPVVSAQIWVRAGSVNEGQWLGAGLSHVLEHMLFKGTTTRGVADIAQQVEKIGGYINAYTSFERTVYYIEAPSSGWQTAVEILADCMMNATIPEDELLKEKEVILREMAMNDDDPDRRGGVLVWSTAYTVHPYRHPIIGYRDIYNQISRDDVVAYYKKMYIPQNMICVVAGDVDTAEVEQKIRDLFKDFKMGPHPPETLPAEPPQIAPRERHDEMAVQVSRLYIAFHGPDVRHPDVPALDLLATIAGDGRSSRLYRELRDKKGLVHSISAWSHTPSEPGLFGVNAVTDPDKRDAALDAILAELKKFADEPVSAEELEKAKKQTVSTQLQQLKTMSGQAADLASGEFLVHDIHFSRRYLQAVQKVTADDIQRVAQTYLTAQNMTMVTLNPLGTAPKSAKSAEKIAEFPVQKYDFPNGLRLLVREDARLPFVNFRIAMRGGVIAETRDTNGLTKLTARTLLKGTKTRTAEQISTEIESVGGNISYFSGNNSFGLSCEVMNTDFDLALDVLADVLQNPTFPDEAVARERDVQLADIKVEQDHIVRAAQQLLREALYQKHPYRLNVNGTLESVSRLKRDDLVQFHRRFVAPNNMVIAVFGNVNADDVRRKVEEKFGKMQRVKLEFPPSAPEKLQKKVVVTEQKPKEQAVLMVGFPATTMFSDDRYALELLDQAYSGMASRLFYRIRDELGLAYYVSAQQLLGFDTGYFVFYAGTRPDTVGQAEHELFAELAKLRKEGLSDEELQRAKNGLIGQRQIRLQDNGELAMTCALDELYGLGYNFYKTQDEKYRAVTAADIARVANKYFNDNAVAVVTITPTEKK